MKQVTLQRMGGVVAVAAVLAASACLAGPRFGSSVTLRVNGEADYKSPRETAELKEGLALSQGHTILPEGATYVDAAITMGGIIRVKDGNDLYLKQLEQRSEGLPDSDKEYSRYVILKMERGTLYVNAGEECDCLALKIETPAGDILSSGSRFIVTAEESGWTVKGISGKTRIVPAGAGEDEETLVEENETGVITRDGRVLKVEVTDTKSGDPEVMEYQAFQFSTQGLEEYLMCLGEDGCVCFDCFTDWMARNLPGEPRSSPPLRFEGDPKEWFDVSPATRR